MLAEGVLPDAVVRGALGQIEAFMFTQEGRCAAVQKVGLLIDRIDTLRALDAPCLQCAPVAGVLKVPIKTELSLVLEGRSRKSEGWQSTTGGGNETFAYTDWRRGSSSI